MIAIIADKDTATGFRLAGISRIYEFSEKEGENAEIAATHENLSRTLEKLANECSIIIITERLAEKVRGKIREINANKRGVAPIIVEIPDKRGAIEKEMDEISRLIKRAVGIAIK